MTKLEKKNINELLYMAQMAKDAMVDGDGLAKDEDGGYTHNAMVALNWMNELLRSLDLSVEEGKVTSTMDSI